MAWELILAILAGLLIGTFTGITPGIHINTVTAILLANLTLFSAFSSLSLVIFIISLALTHTVLDFIPSILTGATDEESFLSVLPGHEMLKQGKGKEAILMVLIGAITSIPLIIMITPFFVKIIPLIYNQIKFVIPFILIFISLYTITREKELWTALVVFLATGLLGFVSLNSPIKEPLLPLLGGLFGGSSLVISLWQNTKIPKQDRLKIPKFKEIKKEYGEALIGSIISAPLCSFLPAIGSGQAATISSEMISQSRRGFLMMLGIINVLVMVLSFATLYSINKTRTGAAAAVKTIIGSMSIQNLWTIILISVITILLTSIIALAITNYFIKLIEKIDYRKISWVMILILTAAVLLFSNFLGFIVFITSTAWGVFTIKSNIRRINMMGVLLLPTIILYLTNQF